MGIFDKILGRKSDKNKPQKKEQINLDDIWYSTPTISNEFPQISDLANTTEYDISIHEDDYRQIEFLNFSAKQLIEEEIKEIKDKWENHSKKSDNYTLFKSCHVRSTIGSPNLNIAFDELKSLLKTENSGQVIINGQALTEGFAIKTQNTTYFGILSENQVTELCIATWNKESVNEILEINKKFDLLFVNWPNYEMIK